MTVFERSILINNKTKISVRDLFASVEERLIENKIILLTGKLGCGRNFLLANILSNFQAQLTKKSRIYRINLDGSEKDIEIRLLEFFYNEFRLSIMTPAF